MKKTLMILALMLAFSGCSFASPTESIDHTIHIGVDIHMPPYSYVNDNGILKGFFVDIINAIALESGTDIEIIPMRFYEIEDARSSGKISANISSQRDISLNETLASNEIISSSEVIFTRIDNHSIVEPEDLRTERVTIQKGSINSLYLYFVNPDQVSYVENQQQGILAIMNGNTDVFIGDKLTGLYTIQKWKQDNFIKVVGGDKNKKSYFFVADLENKEIINLLNSSLDDIILNGTYDTIYKKWYGENFSTNYALDRRRLMITYTVLAVMALVILFIFVWNRSLTRRVNQRTVELNDKNLELDNSNRFNMDILNNVLSGLFTTDREDTITFMNSRMKTTLSDSTGRMIGHSLSDTPLSAVYDSAMFSRVLEHGESFRDNETEIQVRGDTRVFVYHIYPLYASTGQINGTVVSIRDITSEKQLKMEKERKDRLNSMGLIAAGFAHEIRNPLMTIKTLIDILPQKIESQRYRDKLMQVVPEEVSRMNSLISEMLDYSRVKIGAVKKLSLSELVQSSLASVQTEEIHINCDINPDYHIFGNYEKLKQVLINILGNALDAMEAGGTLSLNAIQTGTTIELRIQDDGCGIAPEHLPQITDPFFSRKAKGTGLGLFVSYQILKEHHGDIAFESELGKGTIVTITLSSIDYRRQTHA